jgi:ribosomal protein S18 acetylase RimI-like enzyme
MSKPLIKALRPGDEALLEAFLLPRIESSMFLVGNMRASGLNDNGRAYEGSYVAALKGGKITGVVAHYWNQNLVFQAPVHLNLLWRAAVETSQRPIGGLIGPNDQVAMAKQALEIDDSRVQMDETEKLYSLRLDDLVVPEDLSSGRVAGRRIEPRDLELLTQWTVAYSIEAIGAKDSPQLWEKSKSSVERSLKEGRTWVLESHSEPVASSSFNTAIKEAVQVGGVWTPPELRRRGYGRSVVAASLLDARSEGAEKAILFTGENNLAAQRAYTALGFRHIGDYRILLLHSPIEVV